MKNLYKVGLTFLTVLIGVSFGVKAQNSVGIGTSTPDANAVLHLASPNQGLMIPKIDSITLVDVMAPTLDANDDGLLVYVDDLNAFAYWDGDSLDWYLINENIGGTSNDNDWYVLDDTLFAAKDHVNIGGSAEVNTKLVVQSFKERAVHISNTGLGTKSFGMISQAGNASDQNTGIRSEAYGGATDTTIGLVAEAINVGNLGVGVSGAGHGFNAGAKVFGGLFQTNGGVTDTLYGVFGKANGGAYNYAGYFSDGNVFVQDTLQVFGNSFGPGAVLQDADGTGKLVWAPASGGADTDWDELGNYVYNTTDSIGIGVSTPNDRLHVNGRLRLEGASTSLIYNENTVGDEQLRLRARSSTSNGAAINLYGNGDAVSPGEMKFYSGGLNRLQIMPSGNIGLGTSSPDEILHVVGRLKLEGNSYSLIYNDTATGREMLRLRARSSTTDGAAINMYGNSDSNYPGEIRLNTGGTSTMTLVPSGNVGIGTTNPDTTLHVVGSIKMEDGNEAAGYVLTSDVNGLGSWQPASGVADADWDITAGVVSNLTDDIGIGTNNPFGKLHVVTPDDNVGGAIIQTASSTGNEEPYLYLVKSKGTSVAPGAVGDGERIGGISFNGHDGTDFFDGAQIISKVNQDWSGSNRGANLVFSTTKAGSTAMQEMMTIGNDGVGIGWNNPVWPLQVETTGELRAGYFKNVYTTGSYTQAVYGVASGSGAGDHYGGYFETQNGSGKSIGVAGYGADGDTVIGVYGNAKNGAVYNFAGFFDNGDVFVKDNLVLPNGAAAGLVLTSDAFGNASWQAAGGTDTDWTETGSYIYNISGKNVGIGTATPTTLLQIQPAASTASDLFMVRDPGGVQISLSRNSITQNGASANFNIQTYSNDMVFNVGSGLPERMRIDQTTGYIGIANASPAARLHIVNDNGSTSTNNPTVIVEPRNSVAGSSAGAIQMLNSDGDDYSLGVRTDGLFSIQANSNIGTAADLVMLDAFGRLGIGTSALVENLNVGGPIMMGEIAASPVATAGFGKVYPKSDKKLYYLASDGTEYDLTAGGGADADWTFNGSDLYNTTNEVGIGTNAPAAKLEVNSVDPVVTLFKGTNAGGSSYDFYSAAGTGSLLRLGIGANLYGLIGVNPANNNLRIGYYGELDMNKGINLTSSSFVGIGTSTPGYMLEVGSTPTTAINFEVNGTSYMRTNQAFNAPAALTLVNQNSSATGVSLDLTSTSGANTATRATVSGVVSGSTGGTFIVKTKDAAGSSWPQRFSIDHNGHMNQTDFKYKFTRASDVHDFVAFCYGVVLLDGSRINGTGSTDDWVVDYLGTGHYQVTYTGTRTFSGDEVTVQVTPQFTQSQPVFAMYVHTGVKTFDVHIYDLGGSPFDENFSFVIWGAG